MLSAYGWVRVAWAWHAASVLALALPRCGVHSALSGAEGQRGTCAASYEL